MRRTSGQVRTKCPGTAGLQRHIYLSRQLPRVQWWDAKQNRWRDPQADTIREVRMETLIDTMHAQLASKLGAAKRDAIAANWRRFGLPDDTPLRILDVRETPGTWENLLNPDPDVRVERDDQPPPRDW